jgi:hypothetical protein
VPIDTIQPATWALGGGAGSILVMLVVRFLLKQYGEIPVDHKRSRAEGAIHDAYRELIESLRGEIGRLHNEVTRIKVAVEDCERRHHERDIREDERSEEIRDLTNRLRDRGLL